MTSWGGYVLENDGQGFRFHNLVREGMEMAFVGVQLFVEESLRCAKNATATLLFLLISDCANLPLMRDEKELFLQKRSNLSNLWDALLAAPVKSNIIRFDHGNATARILTINCMNKSSFAISYHCCENSLGTAWKMRSRLSFLTTPLSRVSENGASHAENRQFYDSNVGAFDGNFCIWSRKR